MLRRTHKLNFFPLDRRLARLDLKTLTLSLSDLLMPRACLCCGRQLLPAERHLCCVCMADLPFTHFEAMPHNPMADRLNALVERAPAYCRAAALFYYKEGSYGRITQALKYNRDFSAGRFFAGLLAERLAVYDYWRQIDVVCPVPLHFSRRFTRGYNQSGIIAREVAKRLGAEYSPDLLKRVRHTATQTKLSGEERRKNVHGAFAVRKGVAEGLRGSSILIIDDVFTTGSTLAACCDAILERFGDSVRISVATLAFADNN